MRPTDENQDGSTRPNLLSGGRRRFADDDNILARLERDSARQALGNRSRAAWHAVAAGLVLLLLLAVAWIAYENVRGPHVAPAARVPVDAAPATAPVTASGPAPITNIQPEPAPVHAGAARPSAATGLPPLVLLDGARPVQPPQPAVVRVHAVEPAAAPVVARSHLASPHAVAPPRVAAAARPRKLAVDTIDPDALADTDVALLSAIIIHDSAHAAEKAQLEAAAACARASDRHCGRKATATP